MAAGRPGTVTGGSSVRTGPPGVSASRHRSRAASCGCAANSAGVRSRALAMPAASSRATTSSGVIDASTSSMIAVSSPSCFTRSGLVANRSSVIRSERASTLSHSTAHSRSFCNPMNTSPPRAWYGPYGEIDACRAPVRRGSCPPYTV